MYDKTNSGQYLRKYVGCSLAWWHNYKWACFRIMTVFGSDFIGSCFHSLFPDRAFDVQKMSLSSVSTIMSYIRLAYPQFKDDLSNALQDNPSIRSRQILVNLQLMMEFFIPVVILFDFVFFKQMFFIFVGFLFLNFWLILSVFCMFIFLF